MLNIWIKILINCHSCSSGNEVNEEAKQDQLIGHNVSHDAFTCREFFQDNFLAVLLN